MTAMGGGAAHCVKMEDMREMEGVHLKMGGQTPSAHYGNIRRNTLCTLR